MEAASARRRGPVSKQITHRAARGLRGQRPGLILAQKTEAAAPRAELALCDPEVKRGTARPGGWRCLRDSNTTRIATNVGTNAGGRSRAPEERQAARIPDTG